GERDAALAIAGPEGGQRDRGIELGDAVASGDSQPGLAKAADARETLLYRGVQNQDIVAARYDLFRASLRSCDRRLAQHKCHGKAKTTPVVRCLSRSSSAGTSRSTKTATASPLFRGCREPASEVAGCRNAHCGSAQTSWQPDPRVAARIGRMPDTDGSLADHQYLNFTNALPILLMHYQWMRSGPRSQAVQAPGPLIKAGE